MIHDRWLAFLILVLLAGILLQLPLLIILACMLIGLLTLANWWSSYAFDRVIYRRRFHYFRMFPGEMSDVRLEIVNQKYLPLPYLIVRDRWPKMVSPVESALEAVGGRIAASHIPEVGILENVFSLRWHERVVRTYCLIFQKRGYYPVGPAALSTTDLFGFFEVDCDIESQLIPGVSVPGDNSGSHQRLVVFPKPASFDILNLPKENPFGSQKSLRRLFEDPSQVVGIRQYHSEDEFRRIHWPATAHTGQLQVKIFQPTAAPVLMLALNATTRERYWDGFDAEKLEKLVSLAAQMCIKGIEDGFMVGLLSNSCLRQADQPFRIPPGRSPQQLGQLLEALAAVTPLTSGSFEDVLHRELSRVPYGAVIIILSAVFSVERTEMYLQLRRHERSVLIVSVADEPPPPLPGIRSIHIH